VSREERSLVANSVFIGIRFLSSGAWALSSKYPGGRREPLRGGSRLPFAALCFLIV
jgi:hypothetical protein